MFRDIRERLAAEAASTYTQMLPEKDSPLEERKSQMQESHDWLQTNRNKAFPKSASSFCLVHQQQCPSSVLGGMLAARRESRAAKSSTEAGPPLSNLCPCFLR